MAPLLSQALSGCGVAGVFRNASAMLAVLHPFERAVVLWGFGWGSVGIPDAGVGQEGVGAIVIGLLYSPPQGSAMLLPPRRWHSSLNRPFGLMMPTKPMAGGVGARIHAACNEKGQAYA